MLLWLLLLLARSSNANTPDCEPDFADTCFSSVTGDLKIMLNLRQPAVKNISQAALTDLCVAIDDALNCTSDIIDEDCTEDNGRSAFDSWMVAIRAAYRFLCGGQHENLRDIFQGIQCWNINHFLNCTEKRSAIGHIGDLLKSPFVEEECEKLTKDMADCRKEAEEGSCREQNNIHTVVQEMIQAFFQETHCKTDVVIAPSTGSASQKSVLTFTSVLYLAVMTVALPFCTWQ